MGAHDYTVVIAERNEPDLDNTVENLKETQSADLHVSVVSDNSGRGPQFCRNAGIVSAETDVVIIVDAHMRFKPAALDELAGMVRAHPDRVYCAKCHHNSDLSFADGAYGGARWAWKCEDRKQFWVLAGKWRDTNAPGEIGCVMGATYAFSREWYARIGAPWRLGKGWGVDEESLSLLTQLMGGRVELADVEVAHLARVQSQLPYHLNNAQAVGVWVNRRQFLEMLPMPEADYKELSDWLNRNGIMAAANQSANLAECHKLRDMLAAGKMSWLEWKRKHLPEQVAEPQEGEEAMRKRAKRAGLKIPASASSAEIMRALVQPRATMEVPAPHPAIRGRSDMADAAAALVQRQANIIVKDQGVTCVHCGHRYDHKVTHTYPNQRRRCLCAKCGRPFITSRMERAPTAV